MLNKKRHGILFIQQNCYCSCFSVKWKSKSQFSFFLLLFLFHPLLFPISVNLGLMLFLECKDSDMLSKVKPRFFSFSCDLTTCIIVMEGSSCPSHLCSQVYKKVGIIFRLLLDHFQIIILMPYSQSCIINFLIECFQDFFGLTSNLIFPKQFCEIVVSATQDNAGIIKIFILFLIYWWIYPLFLLKGFSY